MDSLTQIVLGASVGEVVLGKKVGNKAMLYGAIAGTIPDLDVLSRYFVDTVTYTEWHRGFSHSILFSLLFAPIFGWLISKIEKNSGVSWQEWSKLMFWGLFTHPILDSFTTWGSIVTTWMVARKILENWLYWLVIDSASIYLYLDRELYLTAALFAVYLVIVIFGYFQWLQHYRARSS